MASASHFGGKTEDEAKGDEDRSIWADPASCLHNKTDGDWQRKKEQKREALLKKTTSENQ